MCRFPGGAERNVPVIKVLATPVVVQTKSRGPPCLEGGHQLFVFQLSRFASKKTVKTSQIVETISQVGQ